MFLRILKKKRGDYLAILENYYDRENNTTKQRVVRSCGYVQDLIKDYPDPIAHFAEETRALNEAQASKHPYVTASVQLGTPIVDPNSLTEEVSDGDPVFNPLLQSSWNIGYAVPKAIYLKLGLDKFWNWNTTVRDSRIEYNIDRIFRLLLFERILFPGSKKRDYDGRSVFFEPMDDFTLDNIYDALDIIADTRFDLQDWIFDHSSVFSERDISYLYFDCTNFYFDISYPDLDELDENGNPIDKNGKPIPPSYRKRGPEKNKRPDPIVGMGLLIDRNGIPVGFDLFPGNESEKVHMRPILKRFRHHNPDGRVVYVADRGLNTADNIFYINGTNQGENNTADGYLYGQSVRSASEEFQKWVLSGGYTVDRILVKDGDTVTDSEDVETEPNGKTYIKFTHKSRTAKKTINVNVENNNGTQSKQSVQIDQRQMVYYSEKYARRQKKQREIMLERAKDLMEHPGKYDRVTAKGAASYICNIAFDKNTGEVVDGRAMYLDQKKIEEEEQFDGYYSIVTSELKLSDLEMRKIYRGLATIEESFKICKSDFKARPVYVRTNKHIEAHFTICFVALLIIRIMQIKLDKKYSVGQILESLRRYCCSHWAKNVYQTLYFNRILLDCGKIFDLPLNVHYRTRNDLRRLLRY